MTGDDSLIIRGLTDKIDPLLNPEMMPAWDVMNIACRNGDVVEGADHLFRRESKSKSIYVGLTFKNSGKIAEHIPKIEPNDQRVREKNHQGVVRVFKDGICDLKKEP